MVSAGEHDIRVCAALPAWLYQGLLKRATRCATSLKHCTMACARRAGSNVMPASTWASYACSSDAMWPSLPPLDSASSIAAASNVSWYGVSRSRVVTSAQLDGLE